MPDPLENSAERAKKFLREDPFQDPSGANPFGDKGRPPGPDRPASENPFASATDSSDGAMPREYVTTQEPRGSLLLTLGSVGLFLCVLGITATIYRNYIPLGSDWMLIPFLSLAASVPAITLSYSDILAMEANAMRPTGLGTARISFIFGILACLLTVGYAAVLVLIVLGWIPPL